MPLPKRNIIIRLAYGGLMIGMFAFLIGVSVTTYEEYATYQAAPAQAVPRPDPSQFGQQVDGFLIAGVGATVRLDADTERQINALWEQFAGQDFATLTGTREPKTVYVAYSRARPDASQMTVTIGYPVPASFSGDSGISITSIPGATRMEVRAKSALDFWFAEHGTGPSLSRRADFDIYQLDDKYNIAGLVSYPALTAEAR